MKCVLPLSKKFAQNIIVGDMLLNQDFKEFIQSLNDNQVRYPEVGGYAVAFHGYPRYTKDIELWIQRDQENSSRLVKAMQQFGFSSRGLQESDFLAEDQVIRLGYPPNRIDLIITLQGVDFDGCYKARLQTAIEGVMINFIDLENLRKNKKAAGRLQDLADLEKIE